MKSQIDTTDHRQRSAVALVSVVPAAAVTPAVVGGGVERRSTNNECTAKRSEMGAMWLRTPKFGSHHHSQRWRAAT
jgi:hypothetical protein